MDIVSLDSIKKVYFVGIKGVGMTSLALIAKEAGFEVAGSDVVEEFLTDAILEKNKIPVDVGFELVFIEKFAQGNFEQVLVITTAAHDGLSNPQCQFATQNKIQVLTHGQAVGFFMGGEILKRSFKGVSILGCHGKTTIAAMVATALTSAGMDPAYTVGTSEIFPLGAAGHLGEGPYFVAEADEYVSDTKLDKTVKFLYQIPNFAILNNIDFDHPDVYKDLEEVKNTFWKFCVENIKDNGALVLNGDDENLILIRNSLKKERPNVKVITYGEGETNDIQIENFKEVEWGSEFNVSAYGSGLGNFKLSVPGYHNAKNALSVIALLLEFGVSVEIAKQGIAAFQGTKRRQEKIGVTKNGAIIIDDYAHHPDEIEKTLEAISKAYPEKKIVSIFQPHTISRTESLVEEFAKAFSRADEVIFLPIFTSKREVETNYEQLYRTIKKIMQSEGRSVTFLEDKRTRKDMYYSPYFFPKYRFSVVEYISRHFDLNKYVIVTLGAGDIYKIAYDLVVKN